MGSPEVFALGDIGATNSRAKLVTVEGQFIDDMPPVPTDPADYTGSMESVIARLEQVSTERELTIVGGSFAIAGTPDDEGRLIQSGALTPWLKERPGEDLASGLNLDRGSVGILNDVVAIALSQQEINKENRRPVDGTASTWSSGWNVANYYEDGRLQGDEAGHEILELDDDQKAVCACDEHNFVNHVEGFISGNGVELNTGTSMPEWIQDPQNARLLVTRMSTALIQMLERHSREREGFSAQEIAWTGSVAIKNPFVVRRVADVVRSELGDEAPAFVAAHMGENAGLHGTFVDARQRAGLETAA